MTEEFGGTSGQPSVTEPFGVAPAVVQARLSAFLDRHGDELRRFVLGVVRDPDRTSDVLQATFARALESGHSARDDTFKGWMFRVAFREALAMKRGERRGEIAFRRLMENARTHSGTDPRVTAMRAEAVAAVRTALDRLPDDQRRVVVARMDHDTPFAQIARDSGLPLGTVLTRMRLALDKLRNALRSEP